MPVVDGIKYPDEIIKATGDGDIGPIVMKILKKDNDLPLLAIAKQDPNFDPKEYHEKFYKPGAKYELKAFPGICNKARNLADKQIWDRGVWKKIHDEAYNQSVLNLNGVTLAQIYKKDADFKALHRANLEKTVEVTPALLKELKTTDKKGAMKLIAAILTDSTDAKSLATSFVKKKGLQRSADELVSFIIQLYR